MKTKIFLVLSFLSISFSAIANMTPAVSEVCPAPSANDDVGQLRAKYVCEIEKYLPLVHASLVDNQIPLENKARILNGLRRDIGHKYKMLTPQWLRGIVYCRNQKVYKDSLGPTYESLRAKGKSDSEILESSMRTGGKDLLLDNRFAVFAINSVNYMRLGTAVETFWSWLPGEACHID